MKKGFWIVIRLESLILRTCECKTFGTWFVRVHFGNARWSRAWVNLRSRNKILPRSVQIFFVIGTAFAMLVNARSSNHKPNQEADCDLKRLSERDSPCEQAHWQTWVCVIISVINTLWKLDVIQALHMQIFSMLVHMLTAYRKTSSRGAYGHDPFWSVFEEYPLDSTRSDSTMTISII